MHKKIQHIYITSVRYDYLHCCPCLSCFLRFNLSSQSWMPLNRSANSVTARYGHSLAVHEVCVHLLVHAGGTIYSVSAADTFYM